MKNKTGYKKGPIRLIVPSYRTQQKYLLYDDHSNIEFDEGNFHSFTRQRQQEGKSLPTVLVAAIHSALKVVNIFHSIGKTRPALMSGLLFLFLL